MMIHLPEIIELNIPFYQRIGGEGLKLNLLTPLQRPEGDLHAGQQPWHGGLRSR